jgi:hypothetical protein
MVRTVAVARATVVVVLAETKAWRRAHGPVGAFDASTLARLSKGQGMSLDTYDLRPGFLAAGRMIYCV